MRQHFFCNSTVAACALAIALWAAHVPVRPAAPVPAVSQTVFAGPLAPAVYDVTRCKPQLEWPDEYEGVRAPAFEEGRAWRANVYDPAGCLSRQAEEI